MISQCFHDNFVLADILVWLYLYFHVVSFVNTINQLSPVAKLSGDLFALIWRSWHRRQKHLKSRQARHKRVMRWHPGNFLTGVICYVLCPRVSFWPLVGAFWYFDIVHMCAFVCDFSININCSQGCNCRCSCHHCSSGDCCHQCHHCIVGLSTEHHPVSQQFQ